MIGSRVSYIPTRSAAAIRGYPSSRREIVTLILAVVAIAAYVINPILDERIPVVSRHIDWVSYSAAARRFLDGQPLYAPAQLSGAYEMAQVAGFGYVYPPPSVLLFIPFLAVGPTAWAIANAAIFATGLGAMARSDFGSFAGLAFGLALLVVAFTPPYLDAMLTGNVNLGVAGLFAWAWARGRGSRRLGWFAAAGGVMKVYPFALAWWTRRPDAARSIGTAAVVSAVVVLATLPILGIPSWFDYRHALTNAVPLCGYGTDAVACRLVPTVGSLATPLLLAFAALLLMAAALVEIDLVSFALIVVAVVVASPEVFAHTLLVAEVLLFALACSAARWRQAHST